MPANVRSENVEPVVGLRVELGRTLDRYIENHPLRWIDILRTLEDMQYHLTEAVIRRASAR